MHYFEMTTKKTKIAPCPGPFTGGRWAWGGGYFDPHCFFDKLKSGYTSMCDVCYTAMVGRSLDCLSSSRQNRRQRR